MRARAELRSKVAPLAVVAPQTQPFADFERPVDEALSAMQWLLGYGCAVDAESLAWETMAKRYREPSYAVDELAALRDPAALGRTLRDSPEKF